MPKTLSSSEAEDLFYASVKNAVSLYEVACSNLSTNQKHISLGLAEIALEEIGKSFTCLSIYSVDNQNYDWKEFWKVWKNHKIKSYRAFFYEFFCLLRVEIPDFDSTNFPSKREIIPHEKEVSFYVDFNEQSRTPVIPFNEIEYIEIANRVCSVAGPLSAALNIVEKFTNGSNEYKNSFSDYARYILEHNVYQQDVFIILDQLKNDTPEYNKGLNDIYCMFNNE
jgi:AbiV family abortive infection protein